MVIKKGDSANSSSPKPRKIKRIKKQEVTTITGMVVVESYCRKCMKMKPASSYYQATDPFLDANGLMSVCKECISNTYVKIFQSEHSIERSILRICRMFNMRYSEAALQATVSHFTTLKKLPDDPSIPGIYKAKLVSTQKSELGKQDEDLTFVEPGHVIQGNAMGDDVEGADYLKQFWGTIYSFDDIQYLEKELDEWKKTHKSDTKAEIMLLKELCYKSLEIRKNREEEKSVSSLVRELQELMKTASVDPAKTAIAGAGKSQDTFSAFIKTIEENEPASYYSGENKRLFRDFDNVDWYFKKYVTRPLKNFITQSRDFNVEKDDEDEEEGLNFDDGEGFGNE